MTRLTLRAEVDPATRNPGAHRVLVCEGDRVVGMLGGVQAIGFNTDVRDRPRLRVETIEFTLGTA